MSYTSERQASNVRPPRHGNSLALTVDSTARAYDLTGLVLGGEAVDGVASQHRNVFLTLRAVTSDIYFHFSDAADTDLEEATVISAGAALAFSDDAGGLVPAGQEVAVRIDRAKDKYLVVKVASTSGTLMMWSSSDAD